MPNGFWYASGPYRTDERKPGSAFSKGDILTLDSNSSLSRLNPYAHAADTVWGVATCDSTQSIANLCTAIIPEPTTHFWLRTVSGVTLIPGEDSGVSFVVASGRYYADESTDTKAVTVVRGTADIDQSVQSKVVVVFKYAAAELVLS